MRDGLEQPASIPLTLASLNLITQTTNSFTYIAFSLYDETGATTGKLTTVRLLYEIIPIQNRIKVEVSAKNPTQVDYDDHTLGVPLPEASQSLNRGISVEFKNVSFKYPGCDEFAIQNVSFKIENGQLCVCGSCAVVVGLN